MGHSDVHLVTLLAAGSHGHPRKGGCLLEVVSTLPGGPWTDHPRAVDPVLGVLARAVNDRTSRPERPALAPLIPWLATLPHTPDLDAASVVAATAAAAALPVAGPEIARRLGSDTTAAAGAVPGVGIAGWLARRARRRSAIQVVKLAVRTLADTQGKGDAAVRDLLIDAINQLRRRHGLAAVPPLTQPAAACRGAVAVRTQVLAPYGGDSIYYHCTALIDSWPGWLQEAWIEAERASDSRLVASDSVNPWPLLPAAC
jgi:hypothetical protein